MLKLIPALLSLTLLLIFCDNKTEVIDSKKSNSNDRELQTIKDKYESSLDSVKEEISSLTRHKAEIQRNETFLNANIHQILKKSALDHIIIGSKNLDSTKSFLHQVLGFSIKKGTKHKNGIENIFVEFEDGSEVEFITVKTPFDDLSKEYDSLLALEKYGFQFALRIQDLEEFRKYYSLIDPTYNMYYDNPSFKIFAQEIIDEEFPVFFLEHSNQKFNTITNHENLTYGLSAVWLKTKNIRRSIELFTERGFVLIDTVKVADISSKTVLLGNDMFSLILIQDKENEIAGISLKTKEINKLNALLKKRLEANIKIVKNKRGMSISLSPKITKSIWFEFLQEN